MLDAPSERTLRNPFWAVPAGRRAAASQDRVRGRQGRRAKGVGRANLVRERIFGGFVTFLLFCFFFGGGSVTKRFVGLLHEVGFHRGGGQWWWWRSLSQPAASQQRPQGLVEDVASSPVRAGKPPWDRLVLPEMPETAEGRQHRPEGGRRGRAGRGRGDRGSSRRGPPPPPPRAPRPSSRRRRPPAASPQTKPERRRTG